jgi:hypothetical protein
MGVPIPEHAEAALGKVRAASPHMPFRAFGDSSVFA